VNSLMSSARESIREGEIGVVVFDATNWTVDAFERGVKKPSNSKINFKFKYVKDRLG
jgi:hypothetical protein